jgi:MoaA/NifB/PqqE/SkfB family radical SAM enzyme
VPRAVHLHRGLDGLTERMAEGITRAKKFGIPVNASVTVNRLVNYEELPQTLQKLGFEAVVVFLSAARTVGFYLAGVRWGLTPG